MWFRRPFIGPVGIFLLQWSCAAPVSAPILPRAEGTGAVSGDTGEVSQPADTGPVEEVAAYTYEHLPVFLVDTLGLPIGSSEKVEGWLEVIRLHDGSLTDLDAAPRSLTHLIGIEQHGSSSADYAKKGYRFETREPDGQDVDVALLDLPLGSDWVLHGPYSDKTLLRNALAYTLGATIGMDTQHWQPRTRLLELFLDGEYQGVYLLVERIKRGPDRVDIPAVAASADDGDLTGGYIVRIEQHRNAGWDTAMGTPIDYHYPRYDDLSEEQDAYLRAWFDEFEAMLASESFADPAQGYPAWIQIDSWIDHYIINELSHNIDAYRLSAYLYKEPDDVGGLLHAGPLWDFDRAWGNVDYCYCYETEGYVIDSLTECGYPEQFPFWWSRLLEDDGFTDLLRCRWEALRQGPLSDDAILATIDAMVLQLSEAEPRDHERWGTLGEYVSPNYYVGETFDDEIQWMKAWILERTVFLDADLPGHCG